MPRGAKSTYRPEYVEQARKLCLLGATDDVIARFFDVTDRTLRNWKQRQPEFAEALKLGKLSADTEVVSALYEKAKGGDVTACIYWLKNRQPEQWRDRVAHEVTGAAGGPIKHETTLDVTKLTDDQLRALASIAVKGGE
ncbi:hypothetical protein PCO31010_02617 [Pandoraea commovens]|uniref:Terminase n=1 Tax=Pandoraea commovens TaxID=2508289 RepID=A0A5E4VF20_9BURK|nr:hypothetical protein PCO31010_02617 [Pandoraea commovens]